jgi:hypothetical protein
MVESNKPRARFGFRLSCTSSRVISAIKESSL